MNDITIPAAVYAEQIPDCKPGESVTITGTIGAVDAEGNYTVTEPVVTKAAVEEPAEVEAEPVEEMEGVSPAAKAVMAGAKK